MNIKKLLIERERIAYINFDHKQAEFLNQILEHIIELEEQVNVLHRAAEETEAQKGA